MCDDSPVGSHSLVPGPGHPEGTWSRFSRWMSSAPATRAQAHGVGAIVRCTLVGAAGRLWRGRPATECLWGRSVASSQGLFPDSTRHIGAFGEAEAVGRIDDGDGGVRAFGSVAREALNIGDGRWRPIRR